MMLARDLLGGKNTFCCMVAWWVALLPHSKKVHGFLFFYTNNLDLYTLNIVPIFIHHHAIVDLSGCEYMVSLLKNMTHDQCVFH